MLEDAERKRCGAVILWGFRCSWIARAIRRSIGDNGRNYSAYVAPAGHIS